MQWQKRVGIFVVVTVALLPVVFAQVVSNFILDLGSVFESLVVWHVLDFAVYFAVFFSIIKKGMERLWGDKSLRLEEKDEKLVNGLALVVGIGLSISLVVWSIRNGFNFVDFGPWASIILLVAFGASLFAWRPSHEGEKPSKFSFMNALFMLFLGILLLKFFSPQMFGIDLLSNIPFSDYFTIGALFLVVGGAIAYMFKGGNAEGGAAAGGEGGGVIGFFTSSWGKTLGLLILLALVGVFLWFLFGALASFLAGLAWFWWVLIIPVALGLLFWLGRMLWGKFSGKKGTSRVGVTKRPDDFGMQPYVSPSNQVAQGADFTLSVNVEGGSGQFGYRWFWDDGRELGAGQRYVPYRTVRTKYDLPEVKGGKDPRGWLRRTFGGPAHRREYTFTIEVTDLRTGKVKDEKVSVSVLPAKDRLAYIEIVDPVRSQQKTVVQIGRGEMQFAAKLEDPFHEVAFVRWYAQLEIADKKLRENEARLLREIDRRMNVFSIEKTEFDPGQYRIFVRGYDERHVAVPRMEDWVLVTFEKKVEQEVKITRVDGKEVSRQETAKNPVEIIIGVKRSFEAVLIPKVENARANNVLWLFLPQEPGIVGEVAENLRQHKEIRAVGMQFGLSPEVVFEKKGEGAIPGRELLLAAFPVVTSVVRGKPKVEEVFSEGYDYVTVMVRSAEKIRIFMQEPFNKKNPRSPEWVGYNEPEIVSLVLEDPEKQAAFVRFRLEDRDRSGMVFDLIPVTDTMRGRKTEHGLMFNRPWRGAAELFAEVLGADKKTVLMRDVCWVALKDAVQFVRFDDVLGAVKMEKTRTPREAVVEYRKKVRVIAVASNPREITSYVWSVHRRSKDGKAPFINKWETPKPEVEVEFAQEKFPEYEYEIRVYARDENGVYLRDAVTNVAVADRMLLTFVEHSLTPYLKIGTQLIERKAGVPSDQPAASLHARVGETIKMEGHIREQKVRLLGEWIVQDTEGNEVPNYARRVERHSQTEVAFTKQGAYVVTFTAESPDVPDAKEKIVVAFDVHPKNGEIEDAVIVKDANLKADIKMQERLDEARTGLAIVVAKCGEINALIGSAHRVLGVEKWRKALGDAGVNLKEADDLIGKKLFGAQVSAKDYGRLRKFLERTPEKLSSDEKKAVAVAVSDLAKQMELVQKLLQRDTKGAIERVLAVGKVGGSDLKENVRQCMEILEIVTSDKALMQQLFD